MHAVVCLALLKSGMFSHINVFFSKYNAVSEVDKCSHGDSI